MRVFIDGGHGTTGLEIRDRLAGREEYEILEIEEARRKDGDARYDALNDADVVILCLPDDAAREAVRMIHNDRTRVIDASTAHRVAPGWVYGFPEITGRDVVANAKRVSNPGCYSTGFIALVYPLIKAGLIPRDWPFVVNAVSGYSGGGKAMIAEFESGGLNPAWRSYALELDHKHVPEMKEKCGLTFPPLFAPAVANTYRGMVVDVPIMIGAVPKRPAPGEILDCLTEAYEDSRIIRVLADYDQTTVAIEHAAHSDLLDLFLFERAGGGQVRLTAALDNLGKGAAGAAVQTLNLMAGLDERTGLRVQLTTGPSCSSSHASTLSGALSP
jgi:N-acetyl-gamma-glutamyl-phosphate reductase